jgi:hypothetical protein
MGFWVTVLLPPQLLTVELRRSSKQRLRFQAIPTAAPIPGEPSVHRTPADPQGLRSNPGVFARLYASHGADADRFQSRVIQFASIVFSHAGRESLQTLHVKKKVHMLIT